MLVQCLQGLLLQGLDLLIDSIKVLLTLLMVLGLDEVEAFGGGGEPGKHEGQGGVLKEALLCLLAILVHCVSHESEIYSGCGCLTLLIVALFLLLDVGPRIFLVVSVRVNHGHDYVQEFLLVISAQLGVYSGEVLHGKALKQSHHARLLFLVDPLPLEGLE